MTILGGVTDGDIRRGVPKNLPLTADVAQVMNTNPLMANINTPREELIAAMEGSSVLSIHC